MKQTLKKLLPLFLLIAVGCAQTPGGSPKKTLIPSKRTVAPSKQTAVTPKQTRKQKFESMHPEDRHIWLPPDSAELEARRQRQKRLDVVAADLERMFMGYADILGDEIILENLLRGKDAQLQQLEAQSGQQKAHEARIRKLKQALLEIEGSVKEMDASLEQIRNERAAQKTEPKGWTDDYRLAILLFRDGQYLKSIDKFKSILKKKYPRPLTDNILFGLASNYFKLKNYDKALTNLDSIIRDYPRGDKWLVAHAISGLIYNQQGKPGKAIPILEATLQHHPNPDLLKIIHRLLKLAKEGVADVSS